MKSAETKRVFRVAVTAGVAGVALTGCIAGGPTYGTDKTSTEQLFEDLGTATSFRRPEQADIEYRPRPDLVTPPDTDSLPAPQTSVARSEQWPESPEETRSRLRAEADLGSTQSSPLARRDPITRNTGQSFQGPVGGRSPTRTEEARQIAEFRRQQNINNAADPNVRNFLSEPPTEYRQPAQTAAVGEFGESERRKQARRRAAAEEGRRWWPF